MTTKCPVCRGHRKVMKTGYMEGDCPRCEGKGIVKKEEPVFEFKSEVKAKESKHGDKKKES